MYFDVDGQPVFAAGRLQDSAAAPPVVLVHGAAMDHTVWVYHTQGLNQLAARRASTLHFKAEHRAAAARQQALGEFVVGMTGQAGMGHAADGFVLSEELGDSHRVLDMALHAQGQSLQTLQQLKGTGRRQRRAEVAQTLAPSAHDVGLGAEFLSEI